MTAFRILIISGLCLFPAVSLQADFGMKFVAQSEAPLTLNEAGQKISYRFSRAKPGAISTISVFCVEASQPRLCRASLTEDNAGKPSSEALRVGEFVPQPGAWSSLSMDGLFLEQGKIYHLVLESDLLRGGPGTADPVRADRGAHNHVVERFPEKHSASFAATLPFSRLRPSGESDPASQTLFYDGNNWTEKNVQGVFLVRDGYGMMEGNPFQKPRALPVCKNRHQAQVLHLAAGMAAGEIELRVRKKGRPQALKFRIRQNMYETNQFEDRGGGEIPPEAVSEEWKWTRASVSPAGIELTSICYFFTFSCESGEGHPDGSCSDCYEISGAVAPAGTQGAADATFDGGAHRSRASHSADGEAWSDDFERDLNVVLKGRDFAAPPPAQPQGPTLPWPDPIGGFFDRGKTP